MRYKLISSGGQSSAEPPVPNLTDRIPGVAVERLHKVHGNSAKCILVCVYGNRAYEDTLAEMEDLARDSDFDIIAAISAVAEHSIIHQYASGSSDTGKTSIQKSGRCRTDTKGNPKLYRMRSVCETMPLQCEENKWSDGVDCILGY